MINIVFGLDDNFVSMCASAVASILANHKDSNEKIHFYFLGDISDRTKKNLLCLRRIRHCDISFPAFDISQFENLPINRFFRSRATYYRLITPEILNVEKVLYLDCDIIVNIDIQTLWDIDLKDKFIAAVRADFHLDYFYGGLLLMDLKKLRQYCFDKKWRDFVSSSKPQDLEMLDQDILNAVLKDKVLYLPFTYNVTGHYYDYLLKNNLDRKNIIVHYSPGKPLAMDCPPYLRNLYFKYSQMTAYKENMFNFWMRYLRFHPGFWFKAKHWKRIREMKEKERRGE